jgi:AraC-like DNA-binding protein
VMHEYVRVMRHGPVSDARIELTYAPPPHCYLYANWFECPIEFECPRNALIIPAKWRAVANVDFDEGTWNTSLGRCEAMCASTDERDTLTRVRQVLFDALEKSDGATPPNLETVSELLHISSRTLIRRLRAMDTTFQAVTDEVLKQRARELLGNRANRLHDIAERLGYRDPASFRRAFKRWYGMTPGDYRTRVLAGVRS